jgi:hypothetical protein
MNTSEKVVSYLRKHPNAPICDGCLQAELKVASPVTRMPEGLNPEFVRREIASCHRCGLSKLTTTVYRLPTPAEARSVKRQQFD